MTCRSSAAFENGGEILGACYIAVFALLVSTPTRAEDVLIVAHRGASRDAPENTIPAFTLAWKQGADAIEGDFYLTKDGQIVCIHDKDTKRVAGKNLAVSQSTLGELRKLDVGAYRGKEFEGTVIPTIAEVFSTVPKQKKIYVEIKCGIEIIPALLEEIDKSGLTTEQIVVICFDKKVIQAMKTKAPQYKAFWLSGFKKDKSGTVSPSLEAVLTTLKQVKADGFSSTKDIVDESFVEKVKAEGYEYHVWTIDDVETARRFKKWGAKSITTNAPGYIRANLIEHNATAEANKPRL